MGAGASKAPIPANHPAGVAFRRKLEEIRRRRKVRASRDSIVSTTELLKDIADLGRASDVARLSSVGLDVSESAEATEATGGPVNNGKPDVNAKEELGAVMVNEEKKEEEKGELAQIEVKEEVPAPEVVTKKVEIAEAVTSLAAEVALLKIEEEGEEEEEEEEVKDGSELVAGDLPGSPSFRYFALINNQAGNSDSDDNHEAPASNVKGDELEEEGT